MHLTLIILVCSSSIIIIWIDSYPIFIFMIITVILLFGIKKIKKNNFFIFHNHKNNTQLHKSKTQKVWTLSPYIFLALQYVHRHRRNVIYSTQFFSETRVDLFLFSHILSDFFSRFSIVVIPHYSKNNLHQPTIFLRPTRK